jgi:farnesyl diphosphate synthase
MPKPPKQESFTPMSKKSPTMDPKLRKAIDEVASALNEKMGKLLPAAENGEGRVIEAMRYSALSGGKRLRPFIAVTAAKMFGVGKDSALQVGAAIEFVHTYSLVHDDLPSMDNDDTRRGQPSCHIMFDEATALLAGDGLLTLAFETLADEATHVDPKVRLELVYALSQAAGCLGMVGGQMMDLLAESRDDMSIPEIIRLQRMKTGRLFGFACEAGAILGKASQPMRHALSRYANDLGLAFQMTDDLLDVEGNEKDMGKAARKDKTQGKATLVGAIGIERAREQAFILADQAKNHLRSFDERADMLRLLADYVVEGKS